MIFIKGIIFVLVSGIMVGCSSTHHKPKPTKNTGPQIYTKSIFSPADKLDFRANGQKKSYYLVVDSHANLFSIDHKTSKKSFFGRYRVSESGDLLIFVGALPLLEPLVLKRVSPERFEGRLDEHRISIDVLQPKNGTRTNKQTYNANKSKKSNRSRYLAASYAMGAGRTIGTIALGKYPENPFKAESFINYECNNISKKYPEYQNLVISKCVNVATQKYY